MIRITIDSALASQLGNLQTPAELHDESGRVLGYLTPAIASAAYAQADPGISEAELDHREANGGGRPLQDILRDLEKRG